MRVPNLVLAVLTALAASGSAAPGSPGLSRNEKCLKAVVSQCPGGSANAKKDCALFLRSTVTPCATTRTNTQTNTKTAKAVTATIQVATTATQIVTTTSVATIRASHVVTKTSVITKFPTIETTEIGTETTTSTLSVTAKTTSTTTTTVETVTATSTKVSEKRNNGRGYGNGCQPTTALPVKVPQYASICGSLDYSSVCSYLGVRGSVTKLQPTTINKYTTKTITVTPTSTAHTTTTIVTKKTLTIPGTSSIDVTKTTSITQTTLIPTTITKHSTTTTTAMETTTVDTSTEVTTISVTATVSSAPPVPTFNMKIGDSGSDFIGLTYPNGFKFDSITYSDKFSIEAGTGFLTVRGEYLCVDKDSSFATVEHKAILGANDACMICALGQNNAVDCHTSKPGSSATSFVLIDGQIVWYDPMTRADLTPMSLFYDSLRYSS